MTKNRSLVVLLVVVALTVVLTGGLMASNMGFKLNRVLVSGSEETSNSGQQFVALPYNRQVGIDTAKELFIDIELVGTVQNIQKYLTLTDTYQTYGKGDDDFALEAGQGLLIKMDATTNYIVVGSHDPSLQIQLEAGGGASKSGTNLFAPPYHGTASNAQDLFIELGDTNVQNIQKYLTATDTFQTYGKGDTNYDINPGEAYFVKMNQTKLYTPSHY